MKVLFAANLGDISASGRQRLWAIEKEATIVRTISKDEYKPRFPRTRNRIAKLLRQPLWLIDYRRLANVLVSECKQLQPDIVWMEWPRDISAGTIHRIREVCPSATLISFQDDNPWGDRVSDKWLWKTYFHVAPHFDLHLVKRASDTSNLRMLGAKKCREWVHGIYPPLFFAPNNKSERNLPITFIGTCMDKRAEFIGELLNAGLPVHVFGSHWERRSSLPKLFPSYFHSAVEGTAYANVLRQSKISLGFVSESNCDEWTMRTFEITACGAMFLAKRTPAHESFYREGIEAEFFTSTSECIRMAETLLIDPERSRAIALAGYEKCQQLGTLRQRVSEVFKEIEEVFHR